MHKPAPVRQPLLYEINTRSWLRELAANAGRPLTLAAVPESEIARWQRLGFTHIWLMGLWQTAPQSVAVSRAGPQRRQWAKLIPDLRTEDITGSPYAVAGYVVSPALGGEAGLAEFRQKLAAYDLRLILDFIPNHTGLGHPWIAARPELFVHCHSSQPETFFAATVRGPRWIAHGKDPFFPAWTDTAQLDYRNPATHTAMIQELKSVAARCDGVRCDMAMLVLREVFTKNWARFTPVGPPAAGEFWSAAIPAIKATHPEFLFLGEVYWNLEQTLLDLGFDYTYDKQLLDLLLARDPPQVQRHLLAQSPARLRHSAHFLENHDELRAATRFSVPEHRAVALLMLGLPGMRLLFDGQLTGATAPASIHLSRRPEPPTQPEITACYRDLLAAISVTSVGQGRAQLIEPRPAWPENPTAADLLIVQWQAAPPSFHLVVVNLASHPSQGYLPLALESPAEHTWQARNLLGPEVLVRKAPDLREPGLYLDLPAYGAQLLHFQPQLTSA